MFKGHRPNGAPADRQLVRSINRSTVLRLIREHGPTSRAHIARMAGLSQVTVSAIVAELVDRRIVFEGDQAPSTGGRPPTLLQLNPDSFWVVGIKLMDDRLVGAATNLELDELAETEIRLTGSSPEEVVDAIEALVARLADGWNSDPGRLLGVGIGMAGVVDGEAGVCRYSPFLKWQDVPIGEMAERRLDVPVFVENDVNTLALAEHWFGLGRGVGDFVLVTLGRGVGLGIVNEGRLFRGANGGAGEFGHTLVDGSRKLCACGNRGCLEASVSDLALLAEAGVVRAEAGLPRPTSVGEVYEMARSDQALMRMLEKAGRQFGRGLANVVNLFAPALVVVSGEGIRDADPLLSAARTEVDKHVFVGLRGTFDVTAEQLPDGAWARGAASLVVSEVFEMPTRARIDLLWDGQEAR